MFFLLLKTQEDILKTIGNQTVERYIYLHSIDKNNKSMATVNCLVTKLYHGTERLSYIP